jgi:trehalose-6-phosphate synthase
MDPPRTIIVSNRLPVTITKDENGKLTASPSAGGLATAMQSVHAPPGATPHPTTLVSYPSMGPASSPVPPTAASSSSTTGQSSTSPSASPSPLTTSSSVPLLASARSVWLGWPGIDSADNESELKTLLDPLGCVPIAISAAELSSFYDHFSNGVLWPLCHYLGEKIPLDLGAEHWPMYVKVNQR